MFYGDHYCKYTESSYHCIFTGPCLITGKPYTVKVPKDALEKYRRGALIQDAMPMLSKADREFLISGYSPEGWLQIFGKEE